MYNVFITTFTNMHNRTFDISKMMRNHVFARPMRENGCISVQISTLPSPVVRSNLHERMNLFRCNEFGKDGSRLEEHQNSVYSWFILTLSHFRLNFTIRNIYSLVYKRNCQRNSIETKQFIVMHVSIVCRLEAKLFLQRFFHSIDFDNRNLHMSIEEHNRSQRIHYTYTLRQNRHTWNAHCGYKRKYQFMLLLFQLRIENILRTQTNDIIYSFAFSKRC